MLQQESAFSFPVPLVLLRAGYNHGTSVVSTEKASAAVAWGGCPHLYTAQGVAGWLSAMTLLDRCGRFQSYKLHSRRGRSISTASIQLNRYFRSPGLVAGFFVGGGLASPALAIRAMAVIGPHSKPANRTRTSESPRAIGRPAQTIERHVSAPWELAGARIEEKPAGERWRRSARRSRRIAASCQHDRTRPLPGGLSVGR